jgi:hypothetical protein
MMVSSIPIMSAGVMTNSPYLSFILPIASATAWDFEANTSSWSRSEDDKAILIWWQEEQSRSKGKVQYEEVTQLFH